MAESRAERKARRALIEAAEGSGEKKSSKKSKSSQDAKGKSAKAKRPGSRRNEDKASQNRSKRPYKNPVPSATPTPIIIVNTVPSAKNPVKLLTTVVIM